MSAVDNNMHNDYSNSDFANGMDSGSSEGIERRADTTHREIAKVDASSIAASEDGVKLQSTTGDGNTDPLSRMAQSNPLPQTQIESSPLTPEKIDIAIQEILNDSELMEMLLEQSLNDPAMTGAGA